MSASSTTHSAYLQDLTEFVGTGWNRFWFRASSAEQLVWLTRCTSFAALSWLVLMSFELTEMFASNGWLSPQSVHQATTNGDVTRSSPGFSYLFWIDSVMLLWAVHGLAMVVAALSALMVAPRITTPGTLLVVLCYVHRAPLVTGQFEVVLCMLLCYLAIGAVGRDYRDPRADWISNVIIRLIQVHVCAFYLMIAASKLGTPIWWSGDATWYLVMDTQHSLFDLSWLTNYNLLINGITHFWLLGEILFPILIWQPRMRSLMLVLSGILWLVTGLCTGLLGYAALMLCANVVFLPSRASTVPALD